MMAFNANINHAKLNLKHTPNSDHHGPHHSVGPVIDGLHPSAFSLHLLTELALRVGIGRLIVTRLSATPPQQAKAMYNNFVAQPKHAHYASQDARALLAVAREERRDGVDPQTSIAHMTTAIYHAHGGPGTISRHIVHGPDIEV